MHKTTALSILLVLTTFLCSLPSLKAQKDTEFWFVAPEITQGANNYDRPVSFVISSYGAAATVTLSQPANPAFTPQIVQLGPNSSTRVSFPPQFDEVENKPANTVLNRGFYLISTAPITAYYEVSSEFGTNPEIFSLKGRNALGNEFFVPMQNVMDNGNAPNYQPPPHAAFDIVATENNTTVTITPTENIVGHAANAPFSIVLNRGQTYSAEASSQFLSGHPTGSKVTSNKPIAITMKDDLLDSGVRYGGFCRDLIGDQIVPVTELGMQYVVQKGLLSFTEDVFITATQDNTDIFYSNVPSGNLNAGQTLRLPVSGRHFIQTTQPVYVLQITGDGCEVGGEIMPALECSGSQSIRFVRSNDEPFYLFLTTRAGNQGGFTVNGSSTVVPAAAFSVVPGSGGAFVSAAVEMNTFQVPANQSSVISNSLGRFQMGFLNGVETKGCRYAFFSDFGNQVVIEEAVSLCEGTSIIRHGVNINHGGVFEATVSNPMGCDTLFKITATEVPEPTAAYTISLCPEIGWSYNGQEYFAPDTLVVQRPSSLGCDSIITYYLTVNTDPVECFSCRGSFLKIIGDADFQYRGHGVYDALDGNLYITGTKGDSALILKITPSGQLLWTRSFDVIPGEIDNIAEIIIDSDGMIAGCGQSGDFQPISHSFVFRYDPANDQILWLRQTSGTSPYVLGLVEKSPGGNYIINSNPHSPVNNARLLEISRATGLEDPGASMSQTLDFGGADNFNNVLVKDGKLYGVGRFTNGVDFADMRHTLARFDLNSGNLDYIEMRHIPAQNTARLYGMDMVLLDDKLMSVAYGNETGVDLHNSNIFVYQTTPDGIGGPTYRVDLQATTSDAVDEIVRVPDGYILLGHSLYDAPGDLFLTKIDESGMVVWAKRVDYGNEKLFPVSIVQSQMIVKGDYLFVVTTTVDNQGLDKILVLKIGLDGKMGEACPFVFNTPVTSEMIPQTFGFSINPQRLDADEPYELLASDVHPASPECLRVCGSSPSDSDVDITLCPGTSVTLQGNTYSQTGTVSLVWTDSNGCDSLVIYHIQVLPQPTREQTIEFCPGDVVVIDGQTYGDSGMVLDTLPGNNACDTIVTYTLIRLPQPARAQTIEFCPGDVVVIGGQTYSESATVVDTLPGNNACDTIVTYTLIRLPQPTRAQTIEFCPGDVVVIGGQTYGESGTVVDTLPGNNACDTIVTYTLIRLPQPTREETIEFCPGDDVVIGGQVYTQAGVVLDTLAGLAGCDTIVTYHLVSLTPAPSTVTIQCPINISLIAEAGTAPVVVDYALPTTATDCPCPGIQLELTAGLPPGGAFPNGTMQVCYSAKDSCGNSASCCFAVTIRELQPCDVKVNGCMRYEILGITADDAENQTYNIRVINNCNNKLIYTAIQLPDAQTAMNPAPFSVYTAPSGRQYEVRNPNYSPFYSIRFKSIDDSISNGQMDIFSYTLPAQSKPLYININSRLAYQVFYEAHLNTFNCPVQKMNRPAERGSGSDDILALSVYPNPSGGWIEVSASGMPEGGRQWRIFNSLGQKVQQSDWAPGLNTFRIELLPGLTSGLYFLEAFASDGNRMSVPFVLER